MEIREELIAPMLRELGYTPEDILRERRLTLGSGSEGIADYVVESGLESEYGLPTNRIVIEAKKPSIELTSEILDQAVSYSSHRLIEACYVVLTNGVTLQIFETVGISPVKILDLPVAQIAQKWNEISKVIGREALRRYFAGTEILDEVGAGGFGRVFRVRHKKLGRVEALKVLNPSIEPRSSLTKRFNQGAKGLALSKHRYICDVHDVGVYRGRPFYRMEFVDGQSVTDYVSAQLLSLDARLFLFQKIAEGIGHAHTNGISHCDLKPANILVTNTSDPQIIDFDFCHIGEKASTVITQIGATIAYMDRTIWSNPENRDPLADMFSLGLVLWSIVTGQELRPDWTPQDLISILNETAGADAERLGQIILRCISLDRTHRPQSIAELSGLFGIKEWHSPIANLIDNVVGPIATRSPERSLEYRFRLWKQGAGLPGSTDFDFMTKALPDDPASLDEKEFIFRCACAHWRKANRSVFAKWPTPDLLSVATIIVNDSTLDTAHTGTVAETHPARKAMDILEVTDQYRTVAESETVARFYLDLLSNPRMKSLFHTILDDMARLQCFTKKKKSWREEVTKVLVESIRIRLPNKGAASRKQIGKMLEKLAPAKCGDDSEDVAKFVRDVARVPDLFKKAVPLLGCLETPFADDAFIEILEDLKDSNLVEFEWALPWAVGLNGKRPRNTVINYVNELLPLSSPDLSTPIKKIFNQLEQRKSRTSHVA